MSVLCFHPSALSMVGLLLIALGTGGIKPCVAAFGGDQFQEHQVGCCSSKHTHTFCIHTGEELKLHKHLYKLIKNLVVL